MITPVPNNTKSLVLHAAKFMRTFAHPPCLQCQLLRWRAVLAPRRGGTKYSATLHNIFARNWPHNNANGTHAKALPLEGPLSSESWSARQATTATLPTIKRSKHESFVGNETHAELHLMPHWLILQFTACSASQGAGPTTTMLRPRRSAGGPRPSELAAPTRPPARKRPHPGPESTLRSGMRSSATPAIRALRTMPILRPGALLLHGCGRPMIASGSRFLGKTPANARSNDPRRSERALGKPSSRIQG